MVSLYILDIAYLVYKDSVKTSQRILGSLLGENWNVCNFYCFFYCCTVHFDNTEILITNKCTPLLHI